MNKKKMSKRQRDIKSKLMAAICMLLVSSIMMVSTTYAWFTLSTAPEVTGITTAVGANGNLEMALMSRALQNDDDTLKENWESLITSGTSDSMDAAGQLLSEANITWGNLVDVSDTATYGLNQITLYPAALNEAQEGKISAQPLTRPVYGADGRVAELKADTITAGFSSGKFSNEDYFGVRAVGTSSSMTERQMDHRTAMATASNLSTDAKNYASQALVTKGATLAGMAIKKTGGDDATFSYTEVTTLQEVIAELAKSVKAIDDALVQYAVAHNIATASDADYAALKATIAGKTAQQINADSSISKPAGFGEAVTKLYGTDGNGGTNASVNSAASTLSTLLTGKDATATFKWTDFNAALSALMDYDKMSLNGIAMGEVTEKDGAGNYVHSTTLLNAMQGGGLKLEMPTASGVFADIADFCGAYSAGITFPEGTYVAGFNIGGAKATMITSAPIDPTYLASVRTNTTPFAAGEGGTASTAISDYYGYIIDLAFRTNAAGSDLLLQSKAVDRIYSENVANEQTMGHGASMTFTSGAPSAGFNKGNVTALMSNLRVIFFETDSGSILGEARLDPATAADVEGDPNAVKMDLVMWDGTQKKVDAEGNNDATIVELEQNKAKAISVLVYLDGESVTNADVATTAKSMVGSMNLQFSSSAELTPMDYADLKNGKGETPAVTTLNKVTADDATKEQGISVSMARAMTTGDKTGFGIVLSGYNGAANDITVTAAVGGTTVTGTPYAVNGLQGYLFEYAGITADTEVVITVTPKAATT